MIWLVVGLALGLVVALGRSGSVDSRVLVLRPVAVHALTVGWLTQLVFGVATWLFPRRSADRGRETSRVLAGGLVLLNLGLVLRAAAEPALALGLLPTLAGRGLGISAAAQAIGVLAFAAHLWRRVGAR